MPYSACRCFFSLIHYLGALWIYHESFQAISIFIKKGQIIFLQYLLIDFTFFMFVLD